eukprot:GHVL01013766.1.p1 GENE.GHVL01013766.1~~GHVL01013766.1.p1  ORF type:complete len:409 (-),score=107.93 GHVL01013766.1:2170-3396(-)
MSAMSDYEKYFLRFDFLQFRSNLSDFFGNSPEETLKVLLTLSSDYSRATYTDFFKINEMLSDDGRVYPDGSNMKYLLEIAKESILQANLSLKFSFLGWLDFQDYLISSTGSGWAPIPPGFFDGGYKCPAIHAHEFQKIWQLQHDSSNSCNSPLEIDQETIYISEKINSSLVGEIQTDVTVVDPGHDENLRYLIDDALHILENKKKYQKIPNFYAKKCETVENCETVKNCETVENLEINEKLWLVMELIKITKKNISIATDVELGNKYRSELARKRGGFIYLGDIKGPIGTSLHMSLLFKILCDTRKIPCRVTRCRDRYGQLQTCNTVLLQDKTQSGTNPKTRVMEQIIPIIWEEDVASLTTNDTSVKISRPRASRSTSSNKGSNESEKIRPMRTRSSGNYCMKRLKRL